MNTPHTTIVLFGATGDLVSRKVLPALFELELEGAPVADLLIPFTRRDISTETFLEQFVRPALEKVFGELDEEVYKRFSDRFQYVPGDYTERRGFEELARVLRESSGHVPKNELFYLPVHPKHLGDVAELMNETGVVEEPRDDARGFERIVVEKPFGESGQSAEKLISALGTIFAEDEMYYLDHYLGKPMLRHISEAGKDNEALSDAVRDMSIDSIRVRIFESMDVEGRGAFYDNVGAFVDVGQNHALVMYATAYSAILGMQGSKLSRKEALSRLRPLSAENIKENTARAQYRGYSDVEHVRDGSETETYFFVKSEVEVDGRAPEVILEGGKALGTQNWKEVEVFLSGSDSRRSRIVFRLDPVEEIEVETIGSDGTESVETFTFRDRSGVRQYTEEYKTLFQSALAEGRDDSFFLSSAEVLSLWRFADPITALWKEGRPELGEYVKNEFPNASQEEKE